MSIHIFKKQIEGDLRKAFLNALYTGDQAPLDNLRASLNRQETDLRHPPTPLDKALSNPEIDMRPASEIVESAKHEKISTDPRRHSDFNKKLQILKTAYQTAKQLNPAYTDYTPKSNAIFAGQNAIATAVLLNGFPLVIDISSKFNDASIVPYIGATIIGIFVGAVRGAIHNKNQYSRHEQDGLQHIRKTFKGLRKNIG